MSPVPARTALVLGATGLVGRAVVARLLADPAYDEVRTLVRRTSGEPHPKLAERVVDFERLEEAADAFAVAHVFCCLGTTMRKAGSKDAFRRVDYVYAFEAARLAARGGAEAFFLVSSLGADPRARTFYARVKGELEAAVARLELPSLHIFRPSLLLGARDELRPAEALAIGFSKALVLLMVGPLARYRPIAATDVAAAMVAVASDGAPGRHVYPSDEIRRRARRGAVTTPDAGATPAGR